MSVVIVPLKQIILDPSKPIDLSTLAEEDVLKLIKDSYGLTRCSIK